MKTRQITIRRILEEYGERLGLRLAAGGEGLDHVLTTGELHRPGLALAGFVELYTYDRMQMLGNTEMLYLQKLPPDEKADALGTIYQFDLPCVIVTDDNAVPPVMARLADERAIPLLTTRYATTKFIHLCGFYLDDHFAPQTQIRGSLVDVYGIGLLLTGKSGIGKSEIALDLVERGHRLVADDVVTVTRKAQGILVGASNEILQDHIEIRGIGIINVRHIFGVRAIRMQKRIEVEVRLVEWSDAFQYERLGLEDQITSILDVEIPVVTVPIYPGKNITVLAEVIALNHLLKLHGIHPAQEFARRQLEIIRRGAMETPLRKDIE